MRRRVFIAVVGAAALRPLSAGAQQPQRVRRIGMLVPRLQEDPEGQEGLAAFRQTLEAYGWTTDRLQIDTRWHIGSVERAREAIAELIALSPDVLITQTSGTLGALLQATTSVPIVFTTVYDPVGQGFVKSLARPGGNATGFTGVEISVGTKWLELLKRIAPKTSRVAFMSHPNNPGPRQTFASVKAAAPSLSVEAFETPVEGPAEIEATMARLGREAGTALIVPPDGFLVDQRDLVIELTARYQLPAIYGVRSFATHGGLASYGVDFIEQFRSAAVYVDRILRGERPSDLPVQQPTKYQYVINLKTAKSLGLSVPLAMQMSADEVIE
jgi:putative tryptophan/tyrosine transport system substrate-binding protein